MAQYLKNPREAGRSAFTTPSFSRRNSTYDLNIARSRWQSTLHRYVWDYLYLVTWSTIVKLLPPDTLLSNLNIARSRRNSACHQPAFAVSGNNLEGDTDAVEDDVGENDDNDDDVSGNLLTVTTLEHQQAHETSPRQPFSKSEDVHRGPGALCICIELHRHPGLLYASLC